MTDFLDNLGNHQHQKMLREISNDDKTPKKRDSLKETEIFENEEEYTCLLYTSPSPRDMRRSRMPSSA